MTRTQVAAAAVEHARKDEVMRRLQQPERERWDTAPALIVILCAIGIVSCVLLGCFIGAVSP